MTSRERVQMALSHQKPDRVPFDLGATSVTGISAGALHRLAQALGVDVGRIKVHEPFQMLGLVEGELLQKLQVDVVGLWPPRSLLGISNARWQPWRLQDGTAIDISSEFRYMLDEAGNVLSYAQGDTSYPPSVKMPKGGYYFDAIVRQQPVDEDALCGRADFSEHWPTFSEEDLAYYEAEAKRLYDETEYAIIGVYGEAGFGDVAHIPGTGLLTTPGIRAVDEWYMAHLLHPEYIHDVFDWQLEQALKNLELYHQAVGERIQAVMVSGTDFGTQRAAFISPATFKEFYKPRLKRVNDWVHTHTTWKTFYHSCGAITSFLDDFVEIGVDILNPVQCSANGMDPAWLKSTYGDKLTFWGGGVDTQQTLAFGTPEQVYQEVTQRLALFSAGGGYVFNAIHNIQQPTPTENILAMMRALSDFNT